MARSSALGASLHPGSHDLPALARHTQGLALDCILPAGISAMLPNLRELMVAFCTLTPAARTTTLDAACGGLHIVELEGLMVRRAPRRGARPAASSSDPSLQQLATAQLRQLAKLPSLSSVELNDSTWPTLFLVALGTQLTRLELHASYRQCEPGTQTPTAAWRSTLQHVARCTLLEQLHVPCGTAEELGLVVPALQQLRKLVLTCQDPLPGDLVQGRERRTGTPGDSHVDDAG